MQAAQLISSRLIPLRKSDSVAAALELLHAQGVTELAVVDGKKLLGYARAGALDGISGKKSIEKALEFPRYPICLNMRQHLYELVPVFGTSRASVLAVCDEEGNFAGMIDLRDLNEVISKTLTYRGVGSILELELETRDFAPSEMMRMVEDHNARVVGMVVNEAEDGALHVSLKLNTTMLRNILATFERHGYKVANTYLREDQSDGDDAYRSLLKYLDL
jgi:acetoin utilization protein AcuB